MSYTEVYARARGELLRSHAALEKIADDRAAKLRAIKQRSDIGVDLQAKLEAVVNRDAERAFAEARKQVEKHMAAARDAIRKGRRQDAFDTAAELRINGAVGRVRTLLDAAEGNPFELVKELTDTAVADGDAATLRALRRELPALARRRGMRPEAVDEYLERLDLLSDDRTVVEAVAHGREFSKMEKHTTGMLNAFEHEVRGKSTADVFSRADGSVGYRNGWRAGPDNTVLPPRPASVEEQTEAERIEAEYNRLLR